MVTTLFNGRGYLRPKGKSGTTYHFDIVNFIDESSKYNGNLIALGDVVFVRSLDGNYYRLLVSEIVRKSPYNLELKAIDPTGACGYIIAQNTAIVRETPIHKYPQFPNGIPSVLRSALESYYAVLADYEAANTACDGSVIIASDIVGEETMKIEKADGSCVRITLTELRKYMHTFVAPNNTLHLFEVNSDSQLFGDIAPPQY
jgi:hypothetical protein